MKTSDTINDSQFNSLVNTAVHDVFEKDISSVIELWLYLREKNLNAFNLPTNEIILVAAIKKGAFNIVKMLCRKDPNLLTQDVLYLAVAEKKATIAKYILTKGVNPNFTKVSAEGNMTPLHKACLNKDKTMIRCLLIFGADYQKRNSNNLTPYELMEKNRDDDTAKFLKDNIPECLRSYFINICYSLLPLISSPSNPNGKLPVDLFFYISLFIINPAKMNKTDLQTNGLIHFLSNNRKFLNPKFILRHGISVREKSIRTGNKITTTFNFFREKKFDAELTSAITADNPKLIEQLYLAGANLHACDEDYFTPFLFACFHGKFQAVKKLYELDQNVIHQIFIDRWMNVSWNGKETCLHLAVMQDHRNIVEFILEKGFDINKMDQKPWTALDWAIYKKNKTLIKLLESKGATHNETHKSWYR